MEFLSYNSIFFFSTVVTVGSLLAEAVTATVSGGEDSNNININIIHRRPTSHLREQHQQQQYNNNEDNNNGRNLIVGGQQAKVGDYPYFGTYGMN
jgi:hypothetical protein